MVYVYRRPRREVFVFSGIILFSVSAASANIDTLAIGLICIPEAAKTFQWLNIRSFTGF